MASWPAPVQSGSLKSYDSLLALLRFIKEKEIKKLFLDSGNPGGETLTEEAIAFVEQQVFRFCPLKKVALLESTDYHWDNNIGQLINYLILSLELDVQFRMFVYKEEAIAWLKEA